MGLKKYQEKRTFSETPEPKGKTAKGSGALRFVIQKHAASRLHYDVRLELDGVMKSWAVPKGPSLDPADKRLAMHVEDHPIDYNDFEGIIPEGNYGAGTVMIWDNGTYHAYEEPDPKKSRKLLRAGYEKGDLKFTLHGKKVSGSYALVKIRGREENAWLLIKKQDDSVETEEDVTAQDRSVTTGRSMEEIADGAEGKGVVWESNRGGTSSAEEPDITAAPRSKMPHNVKPMLATLVDKPFDRPEWLFEVKWDGYRAVAEVDNGKVKLYSRNGNSFLDKYPPVVDALKKLDHKAVLDGEVVAVDEAGRSRFQLLQQYQKTGEGRLVYYVFDLLFLNGHDLRSLPLVQRKELLRSLFEGNEHLLVSDHVEGKGEAFFKVAQQQELEGIIAKNGQSTYQTGKRSPDWLKIKTHLRQEAVIGGFTQPKGSRKKFGALVLGVYNEDALEYIGHTGTGFDEKTLDQLAKKLKPLVRKKSPFSTEPKTNTPVTWVKPELVCDATFSEWTSDGHMRHPVYVGLREDKPVKDVRREQPTNAETQVEEAELSDDRIRAGKYRVDVSNPDKIFWPKEKITKGDVIAYYRDVASLILPYLKGRPESLHRHPHGIEGESFFQKNYEQAVPDFVDTEPVYSESNEKELRYLVCNNEAALLYLANLGCIELNPWSSRVSKLDKPDYLVMDLDPVDVPYDDVVKVAKTVKKILDDIGAASYPKTSGGRGLHVYVPLGAKYDYEQSKQFAEILAHLIQETHPKITSLERSPAKRQGKIYPDFLQNRKGQTIAAPYCLRPKPGAPVSTPLEWSEVRKGLDPNKFTIKTVRKRLEKKGDLWKPVLGDGIDLETCLAKLAERVKS